MTTRLETCPINARRRVRGHLRGRICKVRLQMLLSILDLKGNVYHTHCSGRQRLIVVEAHSRSTPNSVSLSQQQSRHTESSLRLSQHRRSLPSQVLVVAGMISGTKRSSGSTLGTPGVGLLVRPTHEVEGNRPALLLCLCGAPFMCSVKCQPGHN